MRAVEPGSSVVFLRVGRRAPAGPFEAEAERRRQPAARTARRLDPLRLNSAADRARPCSVCARSCSEEGWAPRCELYPRRSMPVVSAGRRPEAAQRDWDRSPWFAASVAARSCRVICN